MRNTGATIGTSPRKSSASQLSLSHTYWVKVRVRVRVRFKVRVRRVICVAVIFIP